MTARIRPKSVCVCRRGDAILVIADHDATKGETFFIPPGGGIEFGERAVDTVRREMREELGADLCDVTLLGVLENIFTYEGQPGHEILFVCEARLVDTSLYEREEINGLEGDHPFVARWMPLSHFAPGGPPLYPTGLREMLLAREA